MELTYPLSSEVLKYIEFILVDDTDLTVISKEEKNIEDKKGRQQQGTLCWKKCLKLQRGDLKPVKYYWYLVDFLWKEGECGYIITAKTESTSWRIKTDCGYAAKFNEQQYKIDKWNYWETTSYD